MRADAGDPLLVRAQLGSFQEGSDIFGRAIYVKGMARAAAILMLADVSIGHEVELVSADPQLCNSMPRCQCRRGLTACDAESVALDNAQPSCRGS